MLGSCFPGYAPIPAPVNQEVKKINIKDGEVDVVVGEPDDNEDDDEQSPAKPKKKMKDKRRLGIPDDAPEDPRDAMFNAIVGWTPESENYRNKNKTKHDIPEGCDGCETYEHDDFGTIYIIGDHDERHPENDPIYDTLLEADIDRMYAEGESTDAPVMSQVSSTTSGATSPTSRTSTKSLTKRKTGKTAAGLNRSNTATPSVRY